MDRFTAYFNRGKYAPGHDNDASVVWLPKGYVADGSTFWCIYCHHLGGTALDGSDPVGIPGEYAVIRGVAQRMPVISIDLGAVPALSNTDNGKGHCGNDNALARFLDARAYIRSTFGAHPLVGVLATSLGGNVAPKIEARYGRGIGAPPVVGAEVGIIAARSLNDILLYNRPGTGSNRATVNAAYNRASALTTPLPTADDPTTAAVSVNLHMPTLNFVADTDNTVVLQTSLDYQAQANPGEALRHIDASYGGHTEAAIGTVPPDVVVDYLLKNLRIVAANTPRPGPGVLLNAAKQLAYV